ncbi:hypothetical protein SUGI_0983600 [Cryptomeria japonica]|nr:hypothetical protein SUGI_0983600 [Cryptomeria japonica]
MYMMPFMWWNEMIIKSVTTDENSCFRILSYPKSDCDRKKENELQALVNRQAPCSVVSKMVTHGARTPEVGWTKVKKKKDKRGMENIPPNVPPCSNVKGSLKLQCNDRPVHGSYTCDGDGLPLL